MAKETVMQRLLNRLSAVASNLAVDREDAKRAPKLSPDGIAHASSDWQPQGKRKRIEIMVTGDPSRVGVVADIIDNVQKTIFGSSSLKNVELRITGFLDGCIHRSKWTKKPFKAAAQARKWHCEQSKTRFSDAFANTTGEMVDALVIVGHRFDDDVEEALRQAASLKEQGIAVHCFHTGNDEASKQAYEKLASETDGVFMQLADQRSIADVMPIIMAHIHDDQELLRLEPQTEAAKKLKSLLTPTQQTDFLQPEVIPPVEEDLND